MKAVRKIGISEATVGVASHRLRLGGQVKFGYEGLVQCLVYKKDQRTQPSFLFLFPCQQVGSY